jgi:hypothetical protein
MHQLISKLNPCILLLRLPQRDSRALKALASYEPDSDRLSLLGIMSKEKLSLPQEPKFPNNTPKYTKTPVPSIN